MHVSYLLDPHPTAAQALRRRFHDPSKVAGERGGLGRGDGGEFGGSRCSISLSFFPPPCFPLALLFQTSNPPTPSLLRLSGCDRRWPDQSRRPFITCGAETHGMALMYCTALGAWPVQSWPAYLSLPHSTCQGSKASMTVRVWWTRKRGIETNQNHELLIEYQVCIKTA